jgi:hypothetical protein
MELSFIETILLTKTTANDGIVCKIAAENASNSMAADARRQVSTLEQHLQRLNLSGCVASVLAFSASLASNTKHFNAVLDDENRALVKYGAIIAALGKYKHTFADELQLYIRIFEFAKKMTHYAIEDAHKRLRLIAELQGRLNEVSSGISQIRMRYKDAGSVTANHRDYIDRNLSQLRRIFLSFAKLHTVGADDARRCHRLFLGLAQRISRFTQEEEQQPVSFLDITSPVPDPGIPEQDRNGRPRSLPEKIRRLSSLLGRPKSEPGCIPWRRADQHS